MACVELPERALPPGAAAVDAASGRAAPTATSLPGKAVQDALHFRHAIECPVKTLEGRLYVRISAAVYNTPADYARLADAVNALRWSPDGVLVEV